MAGSSDETDIVFPSDPDGTANADTAADTGRAIEVNPDLADAPLSVADIATVEGLHAGTALLLVQRGSTSGARFLLDAEVTTVGRHPGNDIFLDDVTVSRKHAQFLRTPDGFAVKDVGSLNGTYVGNKRIDGERGLHTGDEVQVGKFRFLFHQGESATSQQASGDGGGGNET
jgi:pSer/pThr/pTyr-binding forkhead associated (FHA) protein